MNSQELYRLYREGRSDAATAIFDLYVKRLVALARGRIGSKLQRRVDAEDVVQSAYRSFFVHARGGEYEIAKSGDLWRLLAGITLNKFYGQIEMHTAAKRSIHCEEAVSASLAPVEAPEPSGQEAAAIIEELQSILRGMEAEERFALASRLQGLSVEEIGASIGKSPRTVRRLLASAEQAIERRLIGEPQPDSLPQSSAIERSAAFRFSDFVLERLLGSGAMGKVYRARDKRSGNTVAVKSLQKFRQADVRAVDQFIREAQILASLRHPNIVGMHGLGRYPGGGYFLVMDFVDGTDLEARMREGPLPLREAAAIVAQAASAIGYAHDNGVVHCDLKPGNILLDVEGRAVVTDFGFAWLTTNDRSRVGGEVGGTKGYIAPELLRGRRQPTPASDIYSLGVLLWVLVTGAVPNDSADLMDGAKELTPIAEIVRRCLAADPRARLSSARELQRQVQLISLHDATVRPRTGT